MPRCQWGLLRGRQSWKQGCCCPACWQGLRWAVVVLSWRRRRRWGPVQKGRREGHGLAVDLALTESGYKLAKVLNWKMKKTCKFFIKIRLKSLHGMGEKFKKWWSTDDRKWMSGKVNSTGVTVACKTFLCESFFGHLLHSCYLNGNS